MVAWVVAGSWLWLVVRIAFVVLWRIAGCSIAYTRWCSWAWRALHCLHTRTCRDRGIQRLGRRADGTRRQRSLGFLQRALERAFVSFVPAKRSFCVCRRSAVRWDVAVAGWLAAAVVPCGWLAHTHRQPSRRPASFGASCASAARKCKLAGADCGCEQHNAWLFLRAPCGLPGNALTAVLCSALARRTHRNG